MFSERVQICTNVLIQCPQLYVGNRAKVYKKWILYTDTWSALVQQKDVSLFLRRVKSSRGEKRVLVDQEITHKLTSPRLYFPDNFWDKYTGSNKSFAGYYLVNHYKDYLDRQKGGRGYGCVMVGDIFS